MASFSVTEQAAADIDDILERTLERWGERKYWEYSDLIEQALNKPSLSSRKTRRAVARLLPGLNPGSSDTTSSNRGVTRDTSCSTHTTRRTIA